jgi:hypothetical protein
MSEKEFGAMTHFVFFVARAKRILVNANVRCCHCLVHNENFRIHGASNFVLRNERTYL